MKKITTNFIATKGGNYQAQEDLKKSIINEFKLPDDWSKYLRCDIEWDKITFYKGTYSDWKNRISTFKLNGAFFMYSDIQRMKIFDAYVQQKHKYEKQREVTNRNKRVKEYFSVIESDKWEWCGRKYEVYLATWSDYSINIEMISGKDENEFASILSTRHKPNLHIKINFNFDDDTFTFEIQPIQFNVSGSINEIENQLEQMKEYALAMHNVFGEMILKTIHNEKKQLA